MAILPSYISLTFVLTTVATWLLFGQCLKHSTSTSVRKRRYLILVVLAGWLILQGVLTLNEVYSKEVNQFPPKIMQIGIFPALVIILILFSSSSGRRFMDSLPILQLTHLHTVRVPVELVLYWLFLHQLVPELMTFEGRNFDIVAGITAPVIGFWGIKKQTLGTKTMLVWNIICLLLLLNIVINAILSTPSPIQQFAFEQPNVAILYFPFSWLPTFIVPLVLFSHLVSIRHLLRAQRGW